MVSAMAINTSRDDDQNEDGDDSHDESDEEDADDDDEDDGNTIEDNFEDGVIVDDDMSILSIEVNPGFGDFLALCRNLIKMINGSAVLLGIVQQLLDSYNEGTDGRPIRKRLRLDVITRWNSTYLMVNTFLRYRPVLIRLFETKYSLKITRKQIEKLTQYELTVDDWNLAESLVRVLKPLLSATKLISGSTYPTIGMAIYVLRNLQSRFLESNTNDNDLIQNAKRCLLQALKIYTTCDVEQFKLLLVRVGLLNTTDS